jgi:putative ABC transport system ATP-binding protein
MIRLSKLEREFTEGRTVHTVFTELELDVREGEIVVLLGRSGSGKSTLLNLISGIDLPNRGSVEVGGVNLTALSEHDRTLFRRKHVGFIFQFFNLIPTLSVVDNLLLPLELNDRATEDSPALAAGLLADIGLGSRGQSYPDRLSGGEQQRVAIARALIHDPKVVLADEPTGNLDKTTGLEILSLLDAQVRDRGKTMIMATHSHEVIGMADRVITFNKGQLVDVSKDYAE